MIKKFFKHGAAYSVSDIFTKGSIFLLIPFYTRVLSPSEYGIIDILLIITILATLTVSLEITQALAIYYSESKDKALRARYASTAFWFTLVTFFPFILLCYTQSKEISQMLFGTDKYWLILKYYFIVLFFHGIYQVTLNQLRWMQKTKSYVLVSVVYSGVLLLFSWYFVFYLDKGLLGVVQAQLITTIMAAITSICLAKSAYRFQFDAKLLKKMLVFSTPLVPSSIAVFVVLYIDRIAIQDLLGLEELGIYGVGYKVAAVITLVTSGVLTALTPLIYSNHKDKGTPEHISSILRYFVLITTSIILSLAFFSKEILVLIATPAYYKAYVVIPLIAGGIVFSSMYVFAPGLAIKKKSKIIAFISIFLAVLNTLLNYLLIPIFGISGAAIATLIAGISTFLVYIAVSQKYYYVPYKWKRLATSIISLSITVYLINKINLDITFINEIVKTFTLILLIVLFAFVLINKKEIIYLKSVVLRN